MAFTTPKMGLRAWNVGGDFFNRDQLYANWSKVDAHDHTANRGVQIPTEGLMNGAVTLAKLGSDVTPLLGGSGGGVPADGSITLAKLATEVPADYNAHLTTFKRVHHDRGLTNGAANGNIYAIGTGVPNITTAGSAQALFYVDPNDFLVTGKLTRFRMRYVLFCSYVGSPNVVYTLGLYTGTPAGGGSATITQGSLLASSSVSLTAAATGAVYVATTPDLTIAAAGTYFFRLSLSSSEGVGNQNAHYATLQVHNI